MFLGSLKADLEEWLVFSHSYACPNILPALLLKGSAHIAINTHPLNFCQTSLRLRSLP